MRSARRLTRFASLALASALALAACSGGDSGGSSGSGGGSGEVVVANGTEPQNPLVPTNINETGGGRIVDLVFEGLISYAADGSPVNEVAESIESEDGQNYTITLEDGWTFTDGTPVTASSFVDAWNYGALLSNEQLSSYFFEPIEGFSYDEDSELTGLEVVDDTTFTVALSQPESDFPLRLGYSAFYPLPASAYDDMAAFGENPVGNGPYMLDGEGAWQHNVQIDLVPNPDYPGSRQPENAGIRFVFYTSQDAAYNDLLAGQLDVLDAVPDSAFGTFADELGDRAVNQPAAVFQNFIIPQNLEHFSGEEGLLRRAAISMSINREEVTDAIFQGTRTPASDFTSPVIAGWSDSIPGSEVLEFNPTRAVELWAEADAIAPYTGTFTIGYNSDGGHQAWVDAVTNSIKNTLGIAAEGNPYSTFSDMRTDITDRTITGAFRSGWQADYPSLFNFLGPLYATDAGSNDGDYSNAEFDALLASGSAAPTLEEANADFQEAQEILFRDLPAIPLWYSNVTGGSASTVENVVFDWKSVPVYHQVTKN